LFVRLAGQAIKEKRPLVLPDLGAGQATTHLETNLSAWAPGIKTIAAFPLIVGDTYGFASALGVPDT
jgi:hypothetical protein